MSLMDFDPVVVENLDKLTEFRRDLHAYPELLYDLPRTSSRVAEALRQVGCDVLAVRIAAIRIPPFIRRATNPPRRLFRSPPPHDPSPVLA